MTNINKETNLVDVNSEIEKLEKELEKKKKEQAKLRWEIYNDKKLTLEEKLSKIYTPDVLLKLLKQMEFEYLDRGDSVSIGVCWKRPFWNSFVEGDIFDIIYKDSYSAKEEYSKAYEKWTENVRGIEIEFIFKSISTYLNTVIKWL